MARDYSSRRNNPPGEGKRKPGKRPTPAARPVRQKKSTPRKKTGNSGDKRNNRNSAPTTRANAPGCVWLLCGLFLVIAAVSVYYIASRPAGHGPQSVSADLPDSDSDASEANAGNKSPSSTSSSKHSAAARKTEPRFSFYKMLPNYKVDVPAGQQAPQPVTDNQTPHEAEPATNTPAPSVSKDATGDHDHEGGHSGKEGHRQGAPSGSAGDGGASYIIQAGAFSSEGDANHRKARLALLGVTAEVVDIHTSSGKTVYRVQSSVFKSRDKARSMSNRLDSHGIDTIVRHAD